MRTVIFFILMSLISNFALVSDGFCKTALKKTVAVFKFDNDSGFNSIGELGQDFSIQLSDALVQSGKVIVLSRKELDVVMAEQDLAASGRFAKSRTAKTGKIIPAQILIKGQITEFAQNSSGGGQGVYEHWHLGRAGKFDLKGLTAAQAVDVKPILVHILG